MCGIFGIIDAALPQSGLQQQLEAMAASLHHRGPDHQGIHAVNGWGFGMVRLAIIDLVTGNQPLYSPDGRYLIIFNGEIYNHLELRQDLALATYPFKTRSDTETILAAYLCWGQEMLPRLNGIFVFALWDCLEQKLFVARDRYGAKPCYFRLQDKKFAFASEAKALLENGRGAPDMHALAQYLFLGYVPSPLCAFKGIEKLPAGHYAEYNADGLRVRQWFRPCYGHREAISKPKVLTELDAHIDNAIRCELLSDVPVGLFLSGGLDSSVVARYAVKHSPDILSFALQFEEATHDESADAQMVASHLGLRHETLALSREALKHAFAAVAAGLDEPFADSTVLPLFVISRFAREKVTVVLSGWGGDEVFTGYPTLKAHRIAYWYRMLPTLLREKIIPALVNTLPVSDAYMSLEFKAKRFLIGMDTSSPMQHLAWMSYFRPDELSVLLQPEAQEQLTAPGDFLQGVVSDLNAEQLLDRILELDARLFLEGNGLFQADRMSMLASLELRVPLLNPVLSDWVNSLPSSIKMPGLSTKYLLKKLAESFLPRQTIIKPKKGFGPPTSLWIRNALKGEIEEVLHPDRLRAGKILNPDRVSKLLYEHKTRAQDHGRKIWALVSLQQWLEHFT